MYKAKDELSFNIHFDVITAQVFDLDSLIDVDIRYVHIDVSYIKNSQQPDH